MAKRKTILICGNYGAGNFGDELILAGLLKGIPYPQNVDIFVASANGTETRKIHPGIKTISFVPSGFGSWIKAVATGRIFIMLYALLKTDAVLFGGGCLFNESEPRSIKIWYAQFLAFKFFKKKLIVIGQSFSEMKYTQHQIKLRSLIAYASRVFVRDGTSKKYLDTFKTKTHISILPDSAFWTYDHGKFQDTSQSKDLFLISIRNWPGINQDDLHTKIVQLSKVLFENHKIKSQILVLQTGANGDEEISNNLYKKIVQYSERPPAAWHHPNDFESYFTRAKLVFSMRLHGAIYGMLHAIPTLALNYDPKVENLMTEEKLSNFLIHDFDEILPKSISFIQSRDKLAKYLKEVCLKLASRQGEYKKFLTKILKPIK